MNPILHQLKKEMKSKCSWPEHIEQMCELKDKCPIKKGMTDAEIVEKCPMYGSGKNVAEKASVRKAKQNKGTQSPRRFIPPRHR